MVRRILNLPTLAALSSPALLLLAACSSTAINANARTTFLDSDDLITMTDKMAHSLVSDPQVAVQPDRLVIVIKPILNSTNQIIRPSEKLLYVARLEGLLASRPELQARFLFVLTKEDFIALQQSEGKRPDELGPDPNRHAPDYALTAEFQAMTNDNGAQRSDYYYCRYVLKRITGPESGGQIWTDRYEVKKVARKGFLD